MKLLKFILAVALLLPFSLPAQSLITATVTVTNGTAVGNTITINGNVRTWVASVSVPATQIQTNPVIGPATTNLYLAYASVGVAGVQQFLNPATTNQIFFKAFPGVALSVSFGGTWATVSYTTNTISDTWMLRAPFSLAGVNERTAVETALALYLSGTDGSGTVSATAPMFAHYGALSQPETVTGLWNFSTGVGGVVVGFSGGGWTGPTFTNAVNTGNPFSSQGPSGGEQYGPGANVDHATGVALGDTATAAGPAMTAIGYLATAEGTGSSTAVGTGAFAIGAGGAGANGTGNGAFGASAAAVGTNNNAMGVGAQAIGIQNSAFGDGADAEGLWATVLGTLGVAHFNFSTAVGQSATTTAAHQVMLGTASDYVQAPGNMAVTGNLSIGGIVSNLVTLQHTATGTNILAGVVCFSRGANNILVSSSGNADVALGTNYIVDITTVGGISGPFTIFGFVPASTADTETHLVRNKTGFTMTIANQSGSESTPANRVLTGFNADRAFTNNPGYVVITYSAADSRWCIENP